MRGDDALHLYCAVKATNKMYESKMETSVKATIIKRTGLLKQRRYRRGCRFIYGRYICGTLSTLFDNFGFKAASFINCTSTIALNVSVTVNNVVTFEECFDSKLLHSEWFK